MRMSSKIIALVGIITLLGVVSVLSAPENAIQPINKYSDFYSELSYDERTWFINSSLILHLEHSRMSKWTLFKPAPVALHTLDIPANLMTKMMNGAVPENFQSKFSNSLIETYQLTDAHVERLIKGGEVCGDYECTKIPEMGEYCCPFG